MSIKVSKYVTKQILVYCTCEHEVKHANMNLDVGSKNVWNYVKALKGSRYTYQPAWETEVGKTVQNSAQTVTYKVYVGDREFTGSPKYLQEHYEHNIGLNIPTISYINEHTNSPYSKLYLGRNVFIKKDYYNGYNSCDLVTMYNALKKQGNEHNIAEIEQANVAIFTFMKVCGDISNGHIQLCL